MSRVLLADQFSPVGGSFRSEHGGNHAGADIPDLDVF